jgi:hypothetical protein
MQQTWKQMLCYTGLSAALSFGPALAQAESPQRQAATATDAQRLGELDRQIKDLKDSMTTATRLLEKVEKDLRDFQRETQLATSSTDSKVQGLASDLANLKIEVENLRARMTTPTRISGFGPTDTAVPMGRVELVNVYPQEMSVVVNNRAYRLLPNEVRLTDPIPAGTFSYEVLGVTEKRTRELAADRVYPIYIHQQQ